MVKARFALRTPGKDARRRFNERASKMAIIVKVRDDGSKKRRLIVALKRSKPIPANERAFVPEGVVLRRLGDAVMMMMLSMMSTLLATGPLAAGKAVDFALKLVSGDFSDAYFHFRVHQKEWK